MLTKNISIKYSLLIKSIFLLPDINPMNKQVKRLMWCIKYLDYRSLLSLYENFKQ
jgi:hypothetical protein